MPSFEGGLELKKEILLAIGKTPIIKDGELIIKPNEWLVPIQKDYPALEKEYLGLEPAENPMDKARTEAVASVRAGWLRVVDDVRTVFQRSREYIYIPDPSSYGK